MAANDLDQFPELPRDADGPVFEAPWEAQAFALAVKLHREGVFTWEEWARSLAAAINRARTAGDPDLGNTYYNHWLAALEQITIDKGLATIELLAEHKQSVHEAHQRLHGQTN